MDTRGSAINSTHFRVMEVSYWSGVKESVFFPKMTREGNFTGGDAHVSRALELYGNNLPGKIDFMTVVALMRMVRSPWS